MANEHDHLLDAAAALDVGVTRRFPQSAGVREADELPEDFTEVPHDRDVAATRDGRAEINGNR
ncbi:hypothetical protein [Ciceribacter sp. RN22]|uniref:hypothetical protein n=1 Tax=Ciceribacter sp. RN22 TaxID=2954932 RepID=UPI00209336A8|nr:hypothetical protein [Ciceribacter sp. RN22]MCO6180788.1 hypothetical protein [Ciceribacter sp. RN22]